MSVDAQYPHIPDISPNSVTPVPQVVDDKTVYLTVGNRSFPCRRVGVSWHMMQFGHAQRRAQRIRAPHPDEGGKPHDCDLCKKAQSDRTAAGMDMMDAMRALILKILRPEVRQDFEDFMDNEADVEPNELEEAIGNTIGLLGGQDSNAGKA